MDRRLYAFQDFLLAWFHQDWQLDASSRKEVVAEFIATSHPAAVRDVAGDLRELLNRQLSEQQLHDEVLTEYSLSYDPWRDEISMKEWLTGLLRELEAGAQG